MEDMVLDELRQAVLNHKEEMIALRREFHQYPELGMEESRTPKTVARHLGDLGLKVSTGIGKTGVVGLLEGGKPGKTVLLRADMDALPIQEMTDLPFQSKNAGVMHACGHDGHMAILLTLAKLLAARRKGLWLKTELSPDVPLRMLGDPMRLFQILSNLTDNAIKFTESGEVRVRVLRPDAKHWAVEVSDTGTGIPEQHRRYIFDAFQLTNFNVTQSYRGIGLGLAIVKQLVDTMGGTIRLVPGQQQGATFLAVFPLHAAEEPSRKDIETKFMF